MKKLSYANVVATLALIVAVGTGGAWAATQIDGKVLKKRSVVGKKLKRNTVTGAEVKEASLRKVRRSANADSAANAARLGTLPPSAFVQGNGRLLSGRTTATGGAGTDPNVVRSLATPVGTFDLGCGAANADTRYHNSTAGDAEVLRTVGDTNGSSAADTTRDLSTETSGNAFGVGYATTNGLGPKWIELRVGKGTSAAVLQASARRSGTDCSWTWTLVSSG